MLLEVRNPKWRGNLNSYFNIAWLDKGYIAKSVTSHINITIR